jgi:endonuclease/exonuclease/phosphatase family metal-dependent hydrolase
VALVVVGAALVCGLLVVTGIGRNLRSPPVPLVAALVVLPYLYALTACILSTVWILVPDRRTPPALLAAVVLVAAGLWGVAVADWPESAPGVPLRVVTWNVRRLWGGPGDGGDPTTCVVQALDKANPDLLTLQEVSRHDVDTLESRLGLSCVHTDYFGTGDPDDGGLAACVREGRWTLRSGQTSRFVPDGDWHYVFAELAHKNRVVNVMSVHLQPYRLRAGGIGRAAGVAARQGNQSAELLRRVSQLRDPTILAGDFNSTRDAALHVALRNDLVDSFERGGTGFGSTFHLFDLLPIRIDYAYVTPDFAVTHAEVVPAPCSDHLGVRADLILRETVD